MAQLISITEAKQKLLSLAKMNRDIGESFIIIKDSSPISALIPFEEYESIMETLDILEAEPDVVKKLKKAKTGIDKGEGVIWKNVKKK